MNWDSYFMDLARAVSARSKDLSTKVGCVIVGADNAIRSTGYNGFPSGINDSVEERHKRPEKYKWTEHAERNAIYNAARMGTQLSGCRVVTSMFPCMDCARAIAQSGIIQVVCLKPDMKDERWGADFALASELFSEAGVSVRFVAG